MNKIILGTLVIALTFTGCGKKPEEAEFIRPIKTLRISSMTGEQGKFYSGIARSTTESNLSFRVGGEIIELNAKTGDEVKKDQVLAKLDPTDYQTKVNEAKAVYTQGKADLERYRLLYEGENATKQELDVAQANFDTGKAKFELAKQNLAYTVLKAPKDGLIAQVPAEVHETVSPGKTIVLFESGNVLEINLGLPESLIGGTNKKDSVDVRFDAVAGTTFKAVVTKVGIRVDEKTATFPVTVELLEQDDRLRSGMVAEVVFYPKSIQLKEGQYIIPSQAILENAEGEKFVWVFQETTQIVQKRQVKTGAIQTQGVEVLSGLESGEIIAVAGVHYLEDGQKVRLMET